MYRCDLSFDLAKQLYPENFFEQRRLLNESLKMQ